MALAQVRAEQLVVGGTEGPDSLALSYRTFSARRDLLEQCSYNSPCYTGPFFFISERLVAHLFPEIRFTKHIPNCAENLEYGAVKFGRCNQCSRGLGQLSRYSDSLRTLPFVDRIPLEARFSATVQTGPGAHPASYTVVTASFPVVKRPGAWR